MTAVGERETRTQQRVVGFFRDALGYDYLGHWQDRPDNRNVEEGLLGDWLRRQGHAEGVITEGAPRAETSGRGQRKQRALRREP